MNDLAIGTRPNVAAANHQLRATGPLEHAIGSPSAVRTRLAHTVVHAVLFLSGLAKIGRTAIAYIY